MAIQDSTLADYKTLNWDSLLRTDLGEKGELTEIKPNLERLKSVFDRLLEFQPILSQVPSLEVTLENSINNFIQGCITTILDPFYQNYTERTSKLSYIKTLEVSTINQLAPLFGYLLFVSPGHDFEQNDILERQKESAALLEEVNQLLSKTKESLEVTTKLALKQDVQIYGDAFEEMAEETNKPKAFFAVILMYISLAVTVIFAGVFIWGHTLLIPEGGSVWVTIWNQIISQNALLKIFVISAGGYLTAHFSRNYSAEMNMYYSNKHRQMALDSHRRILDSITPTDKTENDKETHNAILVQVTKTIYEQQDSGYLKSSANPVPTTQIIEGIRPSISR